jgi:DNA-binding HxlR family transcriptional regulator
MSGKTYEQYCPIAVALDHIGDRWTLLIFRELFEGDRRFTDLQQGLPGIAPTLLAQRLKALEASGLVERAELPPPAARTVYRATAVADPIRGVLARLARFGVRHLPRPGRGRRLSPRAAVWGVLTPWFSARAIDARAALWRLRVDGETHVLALADRRLRRGADPQAVADLDLALAAETLLALRRGAATLDACLADGRIAVEGAAAELERFAAAFSLPRDPAGRRSAGSGSVRAHAGSPRRARRPASR